MTDLTYDIAHTDGTERARPRISIGVIAGVARLMALKPRPAACERNRSRGSPPGSAHLRRDIGLAPREDEWWRAMDRW